MHDSSTLRQRAEAALIHRASIDHSSDADTLRLLHELQVHQIELEMQNEALRQAQAENAEALQRLAIACELAEAGSRAKSAFLSTMSHELRTPLSGVLGMLYLARSRATDSRQMAWLDRCDHCANHLLSLINDVLDVAKIEAGRLTLDHIDFTLDSVMNKVRNLSAPLAAAKALDYAQDIAPALAQQALVGDATRLEQILLNLASNAVKFTSAGAVALRVFISAQGAADVLVRFEVTDTGIGINAADQTRLFHAFEQVDGSIARKFSGSGLGLTICKHLAEMMGGTMGVHSQPGQGSTFWFTARLHKHVDAPDAP
jgi:signal transduction histidine kinase